MRIFGAIGTAGWLLFTASSAWAACAPGVTGGAMLEIQMEGVRSNKGQLTVTVYPDDPSRFLASGGKEARVRVPVSQPMTEACLEVPKPGTYAIAVYHDENMDRKFNRTFVGLPDEGYGFSRNPTGLLGIPGFDEVKFAAVAGVNRLTIKITY
ncbi:DUF2141 domain-containing protein [Lacibacterium aquatile]|uniref:DUF2141 domain-containing protein n=1 Tax=Lacibacterium aquatile TaxID=1168082 RepID=A0ABW5DXB8_9PROT